MFSNNKHRRFILFHLRSVIRILRNKRSLFVIFIAGIKLQQEKRIVDSDADTKYKAINCRYPLMYCNTCFAHSFSKNCSVHVQLNQFISPTHNFIVHSSINDRLLACLLCLFQYKMRIIARYESCFKLHLFAFYCCRNYSIYWMCYTCNLELFDS